ncbi:Uncharacterized damage-inducible protein DinB (forms a four-helix bundle) [Chitinophaga terrae (ex Kim and Jung 2007)]|uniref:Uncharacterized damage-inducible protein DinB (Forms a four-helix bundle) n=1 Tax=Chitinophaga terrae (ex Kim and Jung 2007) TaxID=408074 RepID=A0A1H4BR83_9BACT|nr:DUF1572 domain-containing protein [Chitinophaga terrae (ex Kim and Jung 2007)]GEP89726.1 hypothetical protein CTE07_13710 [Chitinophaga terrae (ex Kim and Jung 2007)]SEA50614.1 Uncharacterized damage-inducible protein DinB (forms a four-helix bundle) [Chitinophaga terrae (ex Kim and Jung 2007)]
MTLIPHLAKHFKDVHFGGNWTSVNLRDTLSDITFEEATARVQDLNTIAVLVFHINYYVGAITRVLQGKPLTASDKFSFDLPPLHSEEEWKALVDKVLAEAEILGKEIELLEERQLYENFTDAKYGNYLRNLMGVTEHTHYHLGQISILKKLIRNKK